MWPGLSDWTAALLLVVAPPNRNGWPPSTAPAASWVASASRPACVVRPVTGLSWVTVAVVTARWLTPPMTSRSPLWASTTSREIPHGSWYAAGVICRACGGTVAGEAGGAGACMAGVAVRCAAGPGLVEQAAAISTRLAPPATTAIRRRVMPCPAQHRRRPAAALLCRGWPMVPPARSGGRPGDTAPSLLMQHARLPTMAGRLDGRLSGELSSGPSRQGDPAREIPPPGAGGCLSFARSSHRPVTHPRNRPECDMSAPFTSRPG